MFLSAPTHGSAKGALPLVVRPIARGVTLLGFSQKSPYAHGMDNGRRVLTAGPESGLTPTRDPSDRAHTARDQFGLLIPAAIIDDDGHARPNPDAKGAKPRLYPASSIVAGGIGIDSSFDAWAEQKQRLAREGIELGGSRLSLAQAAGAAESRRKDALRLRDVLEKKTRVRATREEIRLSREASVLLARAKSTRRPRA